MPWGSYVAPSRRRKADALGYSPKALAEALGIHVDTVREAYRRGDLEVIRVSPSIIRVSIEAVKAWLGSGKAPRSRTRLSLFGD